MKHLDSLAEYKDAGAANELVPLLAFVDNNGVFLTKTRALGIVYRLKGVDYECLDPAEREAVIRRWATALNLWDHRYRIYQYVIKSRHGRIPAEEPQHPVARQAVAERIAWFAAQRDDLYTIELYTVILYESWAREWPRTFGELLHAPLRTLQTWGNRSVTVLGEELDRALSEFHHRLQTWQLQLDLLAPQPLNVPDAYHLLWRLLNYGADAHPPDFDPALPLDWTLLSAANLSIHADHLRVQDEYVRVLTLRQLGRRTWAHQLEPIYDVPASFILCTEWQKEAPSVTHRHLHGMRRFHHGRQVSFLTYLHSRRPARHEVLVDDSAGALVDQLGQALTELEAKNRYYGHFALSVVLHDHDRVRLARSCAEVRTALANSRVEWNDERTNLWGAWLATCPGNSWTQVRALRVLNTNAADLACVFTLDTGELRDPSSNREYLAVLETSHKAPYYLKLGYGDNWHVVFLGATDSGKSFTVAFLLTHLMKYSPRVRVLILDIGGSYRKLTEFFSGSYVTLSLEHSDTTINPFCLPPTRDNLNFLALFTRVLIGHERQLSPREELEIHEQVQNIYSLDPSLRRLRTLVDMLPQSLDPDLRPWVRDGPYAALFDHSTDNVTFQDVQTFDFAGLDRYPRLLDPLLYYILHRESIEIQDPRRLAELKVCLLGEAWRLVRDPRIRNFVPEALKTWRKLQAAMWLETQSIEDFADVDLLRTVVESCPTRLFLSNPGLDLRLYRDVFNLNNTQSQRIRDLVPRQQILLQRPDQAKVLTLRVDEKSRWLYTHTPADNLRAREIFAAHGLTKGLDILVGTSGQPPQGPTIQKSRQSADS